jgi:hypothetical protein
MISKFNWDLCGVESKMDNGGTPWHIGNPLKPTETGKDTVA